MSLAADTPVDPHTHPIFRRLFDQLGYAEVNEANFAEFIAQPGHSLLLFTEDPARFRETLDLAVITPEIAKTFQNAFRVGVILPEAARVLHAKYGFMRWPAIVLLRDGKYLGVVDGLRDWDEYLHEVARLLTAEPSRPPAIGIPVAGGSAGASHCHS